MPAYFNLQVGSGSGGGGGNKSLITSLTLENLIFLKHANPLSFISLSKLTIFNGRFKNISFPFLDTNKNYNVTPFALSAVESSISLASSMLSILKKKRKRERGNISSTVRTCSKARWQHSRWESRRWIGRKNNSLSGVRGNCALAGFVNLDPPPAD